MHKHYPSRLQGPISHARDWWTGRAPEGSAGNALLDEPDIRIDLVERVRREIAEGAYETPEKWAAALNRLLERLQDDEA